MTVFSFLDQRFEGHKPHTENSSVGYYRVGKSAPLRYEEYMKGLLYLLI